MSTIVSRQLSVHQEHELLLRLEAAGLEKELAQRVIDSKGNELATQVVGLVRGELEVSRVKILELLGTIVIPATTESFVAKDRFVVNTKRNAPVKITAVWDNFTNWFLSGNGKIEDPITETTLCYHRLRQSSVDGPIITELGGEEKSETTLTEMFSLMEKQKNGEDGVLLNNGYANIFYIRDQNGVLRAVRVRWDGVGWSVNARSVEGPDGWGDGRRVFSRLPTEQTGNSVLESFATVPA